MSRLTHNLNRYAVGAMGIIMLMVQGCSESRQDGGDEPADISAVLTEQSIREAEFHLSNQGMPGERVALSDGRYQAEETGDAHMLLASDPVYADIDGDGDTDAVALLEWVVPDGGEYSGWKGVYAWQWDRDAAVPVPHPLAWQWSCAERDEPFGFEAATDVADQAGVMVTRQVSNTCGDDATAAAPATRNLIGLKDGYPVSYPVYGVNLPEDGLIVSAAVACTRDSVESDTELVDVTSEAAPLLLPEDGAAPVTGEDEPVSVQVWEGEIDDVEAIEIHNGYVPAVIQWSGVSAYACGWVPWDSGESGSRD